MCERRNQRKEAGHWPLNAACKETPCARLSSNLLHSFFRLNGPLADHLHACTLGRRALLCTLIMRSSRGLALYKILKTKNSKTFLRTHHTPVRGTFTKSARYCLIQLSVAAALRESWSLVSMTLALATHTRDHVNVPLRNDPT